MFRVASAVAVTADLSCPAHPLSSAPPLAAAPGLPQRAAPPVGRPLSLVRGYVFGRTGGISSLEWSPPRIEADSLFIAHRGHSELTTTMLGGGQIRDVVEKMVKSIGRGSTSARPSSTRVRR